MGTWRRFYLHRFDPVHCLKVRKTKQNFYVNPTAFLQRTNLCDSFSWSWIVQFYNVWDWSVKRRRRRKGRKESFPIYIEVSMSPCRWTDPRTWGQSVGGHFFSFFLLFFQWQLCCCCCSLLCLLFEINSCLILSDSLSSLTAIFNLKFDHPILGQILDYIWICPRMGNILSSSGPRPCGH